MGLFGRKKQSSTFSEKEEIEETMREIQPQFSKEEEEPIKFEPEKNDFLPSPEISQEKQRPMIAPLFIKIDKYRGVIDTIGFLRATMAVMRNAFLTLNELDKIKSETVQLIASAMTRVENKLSQLDSSLVRPNEFEEVDQKAEYQDVEVIQKTIGNLKSEVDKLKNELKRIA